MKYLVSCTCGHALDRHDAFGCGGDGRMPCGCGRDQEGALDAAIEHARTHPWGAWRPQTESEAPAS
ncbi:MAG TPA: hypothetical protein VFB22_07995 [Candidatus Baltobacteraceae bacterium]|nr:hypothetical protein [Candidatus Baltobacteraceae bacterium]